MLSRQCPVPSTHVSRLSYPRRVNLEEKESPIKDNQEIVEKIYSDQNHHQFVNQ